MQARTTARDKTSTPAPSSSFAPLGQAVLESFSEGVVVFDAYGRMLYANQRARRVIDALDGNGGGRRGEGLRERLIAFGGRGRSLKQGSLELGEAVFLPDGDHVRTLAERERQARSEEHTSELQSLAYVVCRFLLEKKKSTRCLQFAADHVVCL